MLGVHDKSLADAGLFRCGGALNPVGDERGPMMAEALVLARRHGLLGMPCLIERLSWVDSARPCAHLRPVADADTLWQRTRTEKAHPGGFKSRTRRKRCR